jgi:hypothetical protein
VGSRRVVQVFRVALVSGFAAAALAASAWAQGFTGGLGVDLRLEGIVEPAPDVVVFGTLRVRAGDRLRTLGVVAAQTSAEEGMSIFRGVALYPENLRLIGSEAVLRPFYEAPPGTRVRILGVFKPDLRWLLVGEIRVVGSG